MAVDLLELGATGSLLRVSARTYEVPTPPGQEPFFDVDVLVEAFPWSGRLQAIFTLAELLGWADELDQLGRGPARAVLGGGRSAEVLIDSRPQVGGRQGMVSAEVTVVPSGDDPWPRVSFLVFDVDPVVWEPAARTIRAMG